MSEIRKERNIGIELLRSVAMIMAALLHVLNCGGVLDVADKATYYGKLAWTLNIIAYCSVDCYALISGYVGWNSKTKPSRVISIWVQTLFYSLLITVFMCIKNPAISTADVWKGAFFPITTNQYWYITTYMGMMIFAPLLNKGIRDLSQKAFNVLVPTAFIIFVILPALFDSDPFSLGAGYSTIWLCILYMIGGYLSRFNMASICNKWWFFLVYAVCGFITFICDRRGILHLISYTSPTILVCAVSLLLFFTKLEFKPKSTMARIITWLGAGSLSVFLIHVHPLIFGPVLGNSAKGFINYNIPVFVLLIVGYAVIIWGACIIIDIPRRFLFTATGFNNVLKKIDAWLFDEKRKAYEED